MSLLNFSNPPIRTVDLGTGSKVSEKTVKEMIKLIYNSSQNQYVRSWAEKIIANVPPRDEMGEIEAIYYFVRDNCRYTKDMLGTEYFMTPHYLLQKLDKGEVPCGDCLPLTQKIIVRDIKKNKYKRIMLGDLKDCYKDYEALSYDFKQGKFVFKPILNWVYKGVKKVYDVKFKNGHTLRATKNHKVFSYETDKVGNVTNGIDYVHNIYEREIGEIEITNQYKNKVLFAKEIPILSSVGLKDLNQLWVEGHYLAEGYKHDKDRGHRVSIANDNAILRDRLCDKLQQLGLNFSKSKRVMHGYVSILNNAFSDYLVAEFGNGSSQKHISEDYLSMNENQILEFLDGYVQGDSSKFRKDCKWNKMARTVHNTVSEQLAKDLVFLYLLLGRPLWFQKQKHWKDCQKSGHTEKCKKKDVYRLYDRIYTGKFKYSKGAEVLPSLVAATTKSVSFVGQEHVCDITIADTHNFVLENGLVVHNCDDLCLLSLSLLRSIGFFTKIRITSYTPGSDYSHVYGLVCLGGNGDGISGNRAEWIPVDCIRRQEPFLWEAPKPIKVRDFLVDG